MKIVSKQRLTDDHRGQLSAILLQVPQSAIAQAAALVTDSWIPQSSQGRQSLYNLAFMLHLETLFTMVTTIELSEFNTLSVFLHKLDLEFADHLDSDDQPRLDTLDASLAANIVVARLKNVEAEIADLNLIATSADESVPDRLLWCT